MRASIIAGIIGLLCVTKVVPMSTLSATASLVPHYTDLDVIDESPVRWYNQFLLHQEALKASESGSTNERRIFTKAKNASEFIKYLISKHGFRKEEVEFIESADLDYGLDEIEDELNRINEEHRKENQYIDIGGEEESSSSALKAGWGILLMSLGICIGSTYTSTL